MKITSLYIEGYKMFDPYITINFNKEINVLIGVNGSGKSTVYEVIAKIFSETKKYCELGRSLERDFNFQIDYTIVKQILKEKDNNLIASIHYVILSTSGIGGTYSMTVDDEPVTDIKEMTTYLPDNLVFYYSGFCQTLQTIVKETERKQADFFRGIRSESGIAKVYDYFSKLIIYIKPNRFSLLFLLNYINEKNFSIPLQDTKYNFNHISLKFKKPDGFKNQNPLELFGFTGFLRLFIDNLLGYSNPIELDMEDNLPFIKVDNDISFIGAIQDIPNLPDEFMYDRNRYFLFHIINLMFEIGILDEIFISVKEIESGKIIFIEDLSEGEQQLITVSSIKKNLLKGNSLLIMDEPDAFLHPQRQRELIPYLEKINSESHHQMLIATHSPFIAQSVHINQILLFDKGKVNYFDTNILDFKAVANSLFGVNERFNTDIEEKLNEFKEYRELILNNNKIDTNEFKKVISQLEDFGEETRVLVARELSQLERLKDFKLDE